eukprot:scaffold25122_cov66-Phaeocystis_antarctica.AAC.7
MLDNSLTSLRKPHPKYSNTPTHKLNFKLQHFPPTPQSRQEPVRAYGFRPWRELRPLLPPPTSLFSLYLASAASQSGWSEEAYHGSRPPHCACGASAGAAAAKAGCVAPSLWSRSRAELPRRCGPDRSTPSPPPARRSYPGCVRAAPPRTPAAARCRRSASQAARVAAGHGADRSRCDAAPLRPGAARTGSGSRRAARGSVRPPRCAAPRCRSGARRVPPPP